MRYCRAFFVAATVLLALGAVARAETGACPVLKARLAALGRGVNDTDLRGTQAAIDRKRVEFEEAMAAARRAGCYGGFLSVEDGSGRSCTALIARADRTRTGLQRLQGDQLTIIGDPQGVERQRSRLVAELVANQCGTRAEFERGGQRRTGVLGIIGGQSSYGGTGFGGTYRTLCVRTCDGYYFPISFAASAGAFSRDEGACRARCPGADVALYIHRNPGEDETRMISLAGDPYTALPTAFHYRRQYDPACVCPAVAADPGAPASPRPETVVTSAPPLVIEVRGGVLTIAPAVLPEPPADPAASPRPLPPRDGRVDPETVDNRAGDFAPAAPAIPTTVGAATRGSGGSRIRVVGPASPFTVEQPQDLSRSGTAGR